MISFTGANSPLMQMAWDGSLGPGQHIDYSSDDPAVAYVIGDTGQVICPQDIPASISQGVVALAPHGGAPRLTHTARGLYGGLYCTFIEWVQTAMTPDGPFGHWVISPADGVPAPITIPSGVADGELMILCVSGGSSGSPAGVPAGWTPLIQSNNGASMALWSRICDGDQGVEIRDSAVLNYASAFGVAHLRCYQNATVRESAMWTTMVPGARGDAATPAGDPEIRTPQALGPVGHQVQFFGVGMPLPFTIGVTSGGESVLVDLPHQDNDPDDDGRTHPEHGLFFKQGTPGQVNMISEEFSPRPVGGEMTLAPDPLLTTTATETYINIDVVGTPYHARALVQRASLDPPLGPFVLLVESASGVGEVKIANKLSPL